MWLNHFVADTLPNKTVRQQFCQFASPVSTSAFCTLETSARKNSWPEFMKNIGMWYNWRLLVPNSIFCFSLVHFFQSSGLTEKIVVFEMLSYKEFLRHYKLFPSFLTLKTVALLVWRTKGILGDQKWQHQKPYYQGNWTFLLHWSIIANIFLAHRCWFRKVLLAQQMYSVFLPSFSTWKAMKQKEPVCSQL